MVATAKETRQQLIKQAQDFDKKYADAATGLLPTEHQAAFDAMMVAADALLGPKPRTQASLDRDPATFRGATRPALSFVDGDGNRVRALTPDEPLAGEAPAGPSIGEVAQAMITGDWRDAQQFASMNTSSTEGGGILLTPIMSNQFLDLARSASVLMKAGVQTIPMTDANELIIARLTQDPTAYWRQETTEIPASAAKFGAIKLAPKMVAVLVGISVELTEDSANAASAIQDAISAAMGLAIDRAGLLGVVGTNGTGIGGWIQGVFNDAGNNVATVGTPTSYSQITSAIGKILTANYPGDLASLAWIANPREWQTYDSLVDTTHQPLRPTEWASKPQRLSTTSIPINLGAGSDSEMIVGDFSQMAMAVKTKGVQMQVFDQGSATDETGASIAT
jgi:HK97 family phage major capsid protein